jgi:D-sedoheptulose 7-phosphate isomerase
MTFIQQYITETKDILDKINIEDIEYIVYYLSHIKQHNGRLFILGIGGSAGTASHAVNDFRKICNIETYSPIDNISELTALTNDVGWENIFVQWLKESNLNMKDAILILSVGGGSISANISMNLVKAIDYVKDCGANVLGIVGRDGGYTNKNATACVIIPPAILDRVTPHTEGLCSVILHMIVSHPDLKSSITKWESTKKEV